MNKSPQTLRGSFSAVWTATIATKYSFCWIFRDLQDLQSFAPLRSQNFKKTRHNLGGFEKITEYSKLFIQKFAFFKSKVRFVVKILMIFCRNFTNMLRMSRIFNFLEKKDPIFRKIRENFGNVPIIQKIIQNYSVVSLIPGRQSHSVVVMPGRSGPAPLAAGMRPGGVTCSLRSSGSQRFSDFR